MVHDPVLLDRLSGFKPVRYDDVVYRATRQGLDPLTGSYAGGRWMPRDATAVLYTSLARDGALAEIAFHLSQLNPMPSKPVALHRIRTAAGSVIRLLEGSIFELGVDTEQYKSVNYRRTQEIGAALAFLGFDGLIAPSARWASTENLILFMENHGLAQALEVEHSETVDWVAWARSHGTI